MIDLCNKIDILPSDIIFKMSDPFGNTPDILTDGLLADILRPAYNGIISVRIYWSVKTKFPGGMRLHNNQG